MYSWNLASMRKSILIDVLNIIDRAHKPALRNVINDEISMLTPNAQRELDRIYNIVQSHDDILSALFYIPKSKRLVYIYTVAMRALSDMAVSLNSVEEFIEYIRSSGKHDVCEAILRNCVAAEYEDLTDSAEDIIQEQMYNISRNPVKYLDMTDLPVNVKFSLSSLLYDSDSFINSFASYIEKIHEAVTKLYAVHKKEFLYSYRLIKDYLTLGNALPLMMPEFRQRLGDTDRKYIFVIELVCLNSSGIFYDDDKVVCIKGLHAIQKELHVDKFKLY